MKTTLTLLLFSSLSLLDLSCSSEKAPAFLELSAGQWEGTFDGPDNGTWSLTIQKDGSLTGFLHSQNVPGIDFPGSGVLKENGTISAIIKVSSSEANMTETINGDKVTGSWVNDSFEPDFSGTWEGSKIDK